jgi:ATP-dependent DNA helicase DinG
MIKIFGKEGILGNVHDKFEFRNEQLQMAEFVYELLADNRSGIVEAGTGVGKTLAYLAPAILHCIDSNKILAVSTETKALQKQLIDNDLPLVRALLDEHGIDFKYSLCLGSSNYACTRRFQSLVERGGFSKRDIHHVESLSDKIHSRKVFSRFDLSMPDYIWSSVSREPDSCSNYKCQHFSTCVFQQAKKEWSESNILVMNHYLFFTNISAQKTYLPLFDVVVFDEAHSIEDICADQLGFSVKDTDLGELIKGYFTSQHREKICGASRAENLVNRTNEIAVRVMGEGESFFESMKNGLGDKTTVRCISPSGDQAKVLIDLLEEFLKALSEIASKIDDDNVIFEFDLFRSRVFQLSENLKSFSYHTHESYVYWKEKLDAGLLGSICLRGQPLDVGGIICREVNSCYSSVLYTSATLSINGSFNYARERLGLENGRELLLHSPFNFKEQTLLYLSRSNIDPDNPLFIDTIAGEIATIVESLDGNCLVLFTSYRSMAQTREKLEALTSRTMHVQGDSPAASVLNNYIKDDGSVLMGTHSFWQGIDLTGDLLRGVIITRLPFSVPDRPHIQARLEKFIEKGLNPFNSYQVPEAILKFKQGFGRLIRSSTDRGVVAVLDPRISKKNYGHSFIRSIPECTIVSTMDELVSGISKIILKGYN